MPEDTQNRSESNPQGDENLEIMRFAPNYTKYVGGLVRKHLPTSGKVLELGSGDGSQTQQIMSPCENLVCIEQSEKRQTLLTKAGYQVSNDLSAYVGSNSSALFSLNCLEHIEDDAEALRTINQCLRPGGILVIYVPALPILFSNMDRHVGHYRRYTKKSLKDLFELSGFEVISSEYVDAFGIFPSLIYKILPNASGEPSKLSVVIYDKIFFPISRILDKVFRKLAGKNLLMVGVKA